jgi:hypothetical protein
MGKLRIRIPLKMDRTFEIKDPEFARQLVEMLESFGKQVGVFDGVVGIWARRPETSEHLTETLRARNNRRNG